MFDQNETYGRLFRLTSQEFFPGAKISEHVHRMKWNEDNSDKQIRVFCNLQVTRRYAVVYSLFMLLDLPYLWRI